MWFIGVEVEQETSAPPPEKNPGSAPAHGTYRCFGHQTKTIFSLVSSCPNLLGDSYKNVLPLVWYFMEVKRKTFFNSFLESTLFLYNFTDDLRHAVCLLYDTHFQAQFNVSPLRILLYTP